MENGLLTMLNESKNLVWLYVDDPSIQKCWEIRWWDSKGELRIITVASVQILYKVPFSTLRIPAPGKDEPRCVIQFVNAQVSYRENSLIAFIDLIK